MTSNPKGYNQMSYFVAKLYFISKTGQSYIYKKKLYSK